MEESLREVILDTSTIDTSSSRKYSKSERDGDGYKVYKRRWWVLFLVSTVAGLQGAYWGIFGPIAQQSQSLLQWKAAEIAQLSNWGPYAYLVAVYPNTLLMDYYGLKTSCVIAGVLIFLGAALRILPWYIGDMVASDTSTTTVLINVGQILNGLAGPFAMSAGPVVSSRWFAPRERALATAVISVSNYGFCSIVFVLGPLLVPAKFEDRKSIESEDLYKYMLYSLICATGLLIGCISMPAKPPTPPCPSATHVRVSSSFASVKRLFGNTNFILLLASYGLITGFYTAWGGFLEPNLQRLGIFSEREASIAAGWLGFWGAIAGAFSGIFFSVISGRFEKGSAMRPLVLLSSILGGVGSVAFALQCEGNLLPNKSVPFYALVLLAGFNAFWINGTIPLFFELSCEASFPVSEAAVTSVLTLANNITCLIFNLCAQSEFLAYYLNWFVACVCILSAMLVFVVKPDALNLRTRVDELHM
eukprot:g2929.t1